MRVTSLIDTLAPGPPFVAPSLVRGTALREELPDRRLGPRRPLSRLSPALRQGQPRIAGHWRRVDRRRGPVAQRLMEPRVIVERESPAPVTPQSEDVLVPPCAFAQSGLGVGALSMYTPGLASRRSAPA